eukprot:TRINITY_DN25509_c0_g1_i1.p3 TRINITY_DN25509_c0_g1~~TRINITY_DN25509_c0_g1_i1.p3  ORF type:complete len:107 (-),score=41.48 TRINITY_DN25509_c0_g1_i1:186-461(-)
MGTVKKPGGIQADVTAAVVQCYSDRQHEALHPLYPQLSLLPPLPVPHHQTPIHSNHYHHRHTHHYQEDSYERHQLWSARRWQNCVAAGSRK